jgi:hypothetical protein
MSPLCKNIDCAILLFFASSCRLKFLTLSMTVSRLEISMQNCIRLLLAFGDDGADTLLFVRDRLISIRESRIRTFKVRNLVIVNKCVSNDMLSFMNVPAGANKHYCMQTVRGTRIDCLRYLAVRQGCPRSWIDLSWQ